MQAAKRQTNQKQLIADIVKNACNHPSAEWIFQQARLRLPNISLGTVYRVLRELVESGEIIEIELKGAPSRYDKTVFHHAHFICNKCGRVEDVFYNIDKMKEAVGEINNAHPDFIQVVFKGLCDDCHKEDCNLEVVV